MSSGDLLKVQIDQRGEWVWTEEMLEMYVTGLLGKFPASDGVYTDALGKPIEIKMHAERSGSGLWVIAVTSQFFVGHEREVGGRGKARRTVHMDSEKKLAGAADLDSYRKLSLSIVR